MFDLQRNDIGLIKITVPGHICGIASHREAQSTVIIGSVVTVIVVIQAVEHQRTVCGDIQHTGFPNVNFGAGKDFVGVIDIHSAINHDLPT